MITNVLKKNLEKSLEEKQNVINAFTYGWILCVFKPSPVSFVSGNIAYTIFYKDFTLWQEFIKEREISVSRIQFYKILREVAKTNSFVLNKNNK